MLKIFNTLSGKKEIFKPIVDKKINLYVCGVTVYDFCHIGHGRTFIAFDMIVRYLRHSGFIVNYVRNITDVDDKIILKSIKEKIDIHKLTNIMIKEMHKDFLSLDILPPNFEPRITDYINEIINIIVNLINNKYAYVNDNGDVVFSVDSNHNYGSLSNQSLTSLQSGSRIEISEAKKNPLDFILWKKSNKEKYSWNSPWGPGRPGWHIECSAITNVFFKNIIDIHGGGSDLLFPHHENERAQSMSFNHKSKINFWMHTGMVVIKNQKMSKSLDNAFLLKEILKLYDAETVRYYLLSTHYRHPLYYSEKNINQAKKSLEYLYMSLYNTNPTNNINEKNNFENDFYSAMNDDFNTPKVFSLFFKIANKINYFKKIDILKANTFAFILKKCSNKLGFLCQDPEDFLQKKNILNRCFIEKIELLIEKRNIARKSQSWKEADSLRAQLLSLDIILEDLPDKTIWRKK